MSHSISTLLIHNLDDAARRRAAIEEIFHEDAVFHDPQTASTAAATRSIASPA